MKKKIFIVLVLVVVLIMAGCTTQEEKNEHSEEQKENSMYSVETDYFSIKTAYGDLYFPLKWQSYIEYSCRSDDKDAVVEFYVIMDMKEKIHLFDIVFGDEGYKIGRINSDSGSVDVGIISYEIYLDDTWSDKEKYVISSIEHDINYLLERIDELQNFERIEY